MKFRALQENLRKALWERIDDGELTGLRLAQETGFKQAHISNFLNRKRGLSVEGMDKVLNVNVCRFWICSIPAKSTSAPAFLLPAMMGSRISCWSRARSRAPASDPEHESKRHCEAQEKLSAQVAP
jgi:hypothetical protein